MERRSGVLMHVSSLFGDYSIGTFSEAAKYFVDLIAEAGFSYWQILPLSVPDKYGSPYKSAATSAINPYFLDPERLYREGLISFSELEAAKGISSYTVEYSKLFSERMELFRRAASRVDNKDGIIARVKKDGELYRAAYFLALAETNGGTEWQRFSYQEPNEDSLFLHIFIQDELSRAFYELRQYAAARGVKIIGDMPMYPDLYSADVYFERDGYLLDKDGYPAAVAGVPPDCFSPEGQLWGNPLYNWEWIGARGYELWRKRIRRALSLYDVVRLDHFRAFESYWSIPASAESAVLGEWRRGAGRALVDALLLEGAAGRIIAEDLGDVGEEVEALRRYSGFPGMRVLEFGFFGDSSPHLPHNFEKNTVAYTATHDNNTLLGYLYSLGAGEQRRVFDYFGIEGDDIDSAVRKIIKNMLASVADTVIIPVQDILGFGADTRMNTPGKASGNWAFRVTKEQLSSIDTAWYRRQNELYFRCK